jgi:hypothetical protein
MNTRIMRAIGFDKEVDRYEAGRCVQCDRQVDTSQLRDEASKREYVTSGLCQNCQDDIFKEDL